MLWVHLGILLYTALVILYTDHLGWQYFRGTKQTLDSRLVGRLHVAVWAGLIGMILSGAYMAWPAFSILLVQPLFIAKMGFVALLVVNAWFIGSLISVATTTPYASLTTKQKTPLMVSGALSTISWISAAVTAVLLFGNVLAWVGISF